MPSSNASTVCTALRELARSSPRQESPVLLGFDVSRYLTRGGLEGLSPLTLDMPISEETIVGAAIGIAVAGRDVVVDLMFEGFLTRCVEPLLVGWPTALVLAQVDLGRVVLRMLGAPIQFGGPSHSANLLALLNEAYPVRVVHATCAEDVIWALSTLPKDRILVIADPSRPELIRGDVVTPANAPPLRLWKRRRREITVCSHSDLADIAALVDSGQLDTDVLSSCSAMLHRIDVAAVLQLYEMVHLRGVQIADP